MHPRMEGSFIKVGRAKDHLDGVREDLARHVRSNNYLFRREGNTKPTEDIFTARIVMPPRPEISVRIGEILYCLRSSLDHMANVVVPKPNLHTEFPIFWNKNSFAKSGPKKVPGVKQDIWKVIESVQPYHRGMKASAQSDPLWLLHELNNIDKHRNLLIVAALVQDAAVTLPLGLEVVEKVISPGRLENGKPCLTLRFDGPKPTRYYEMEVSLQVQFDQGNLSGVGFPVIDTLMDILMRVDEVIDFIDLLI